MRLLVVDDYPPFALSLRLLLGPSHAVVVEVSGAEALARLRGDGAFDVVFCDLVMPGISGVDLYRTLSAERPALLERFVFVTGGAYPAEAQAFLDEVRPRLLEKPFTPEALEALLRQMEAR